MQRGFFAPLVLSVALVFGASGCTFTAEIATQKDYDPSDGVGVTLGDIAVRNVMLITNEEGQANLVMSVVNTGDTDVSLQVQYDGEGDAVTEFLDVPTLPSLTRLGDDPAAGVILEGPDVIAGSLVPVYFQHGDIPGELVLVPVLDGELPEYELLVP